MDALVTLKNKCSFRDIRLDDGCRRLSRGDLHHEVFLFPIDIRSEMQPLERMQMRCFRIRERNQET